MGETRVFADGYRGVFQNQEDFLACLNSIGRNSFWERKTSKNLRLVAITSGSKVEEELKQIYADEGLDEDIITDTIINTGLLLKIRNQYYPVRDCAIKSILDRAGISGAGLRRVEKGVYARILNDCLKAAKGEALLRISEGKVSAVLGGDCHDCWDRSSRMWCWRYCPMWRKVTGRNGTSCSVRESKERRKQESILAGPVWSIRRIGANVMAHGRKGVLVQ